MHKIDCLMLVLLGLVVGLCVGQYIRDLQYKERNASVPTLMLWDAIGANSLAAREISQKVDNIKVNLDDYIKGYSKLSDSLVEYGAKLNKYNEDIVSLISRLNKLEKDRSRPNITVVLEKCAKQH